MIVQNKEKQQVNGSAAGAVRGARVRAARKTRGGSGAVRAAAACGAPAHGAKCNGAATPALSFRICTPQGQVW